MSIEKEIEELKIINQQMAEKIKELESQNKKEKELNQYKLNQYKLPRVENKKYYYISTITNFNRFGVEVTNDDVCESDDVNYNQYNYFTDENKAKQYADHIKLQLELFQIRDMINGDWKPDWDYNSKAKYVVINVENEITNITYCYSHAPFAFETPEKRDKFIELVGEDKIMKYLSF